MIAALSTSSAGLDRRRKAAIVVQFLLSGGASPPLSALPEPMVPHEAYALAQLSSGAVYLTFGF